MNEFEHRVRQAARQMRYPATPDIRWRLPAPSPRLYVARGLAALAVVTLVVMVSPLRAAVLEWLQIGVVTIFVGDAPTPPPTLSSLLNLYGETTLEQAQQQAGFTLRMPPGYGPPDHVYVQTADGNAVVLVWLAREERPAISLYQFGADSAAYGKFLTHQVDAQVNGQPAVWADLPHLLQYEAGSGEVVERRLFLVRGHVLIWQENDITYRLESNLSMAEAVAIAESLT